MWPIVFHVKIAICHEDTWLFGRVATVTATVDTRQITRIFVVWRAVALPVLPCWWPGLAVRQQQMRPKSKMKAHAEAKACARPVQVMLHLSIPLVNHFFLN